MNVAVFLADGFEEIEALTIVDYLRRASVEVTTVAVGASASEKASASGNAFASGAGASANADVSASGATVGKLVTGSHKIPVIADTSLSSYISLLGDSLPDAVYAPGGMPGAANLGTSTEMLSLFVKCFEAGKIVSALCAAPAVVLAKTGILRGHRFTCYPGMENEIEKYAGGEWKSLIADSTHVKDVPFVTDGNLVTGRGPGCAEQFAMELVRLLCGADVAKKVHDASIQRD